MRVLFILALAALCMAVTPARYPRNLAARRQLFQTVTGVTRTFRMLQDDEFPEWNTDEIEGWDEMTPEEQKEVKDMYDSLKELFDALSELGDALDDLPDDRRRAMRTVRRSPVRRNMANVVSRRMDDFDLDFENMTDEEIDAYIEQVMAELESRRRMAVYEDVHFPGTPFHPPMDVIEPVAPHPGWASPPWAAPRPRIVEAFPAPVVGPVVAAPVRHW